jgi:hypothetical protein
MAFTILIFALLQLSTSEQSSVCGDRSDDVACDASTLLQSQAKTVSRHTSEGNAGSKQANRLSEFGGLEPMLQFVESLQHVTPPERNMTQLNTIKDIVTGILLPGLESAQAFGQEQLDESKDRIDSCIETADATMVTVYAKGNTSSQGETTHADCRALEEVDRSDMETKCSALQAFVDDETFPEIPEPPAVEALRPVMKRFKSLASVFETKDSECNSSTATHTAKVTECDGDQDQYEDDFCLYRQALLATDAAYTTCNNTENSSHNSLVTQIEEKVINWKAEYKAIKKILCYLDVWLHDGNLSTVNTALASSCESNDIDTSAMDIVYPVVPSPRVINLQPVEDYPGSDDWADRYDALDSHNPVITHCLAP